MLPSVWHEIASTGANLRSYFFTKQIIELKGVFLVFLAGYYHGCFSSLVHLKT